MQSIRTSSGAGTSTSGRSPAPSHFRCCRPSSGPHRRCVVVSAQSDISRRTGEGVNSQSTPDAAISQQKLQASASAAQDAAQRGTGGNVHAAHLDKAHAHAQQHDVQQGTLEASTSSSSSADANASNTAPKRRRGRPPAVQPSVPLPVRLKQKQQQEQLQQQPQQQELGQSSLPPNFYR